MHLNNPPKTKANIIYCWISTFFIKIGPVNVTKVVKLNKSKQFQILNANFDNA